MQVVTTFSVARGDELITIEAVGNFIHGGNPCMNDRRYSLEDYDFTPDIGLTPAEHSSLIQKLYDGLD